MFFVVFIIFIIIISFQVSFTTQKTVQVQEAFWKQLLLALQLTLVFSLSSSQAWIQITIRIVTSLSFGFALA